MTLTRADLRAALSDANMQAFLKVIRNGEGTAGQDGYRTLFGGELFDSYARHPDRRITRTLGGRPITSTAAGAYQFLSRTWAGLVSQFGFEDFSPGCQDEGAVALIAGRRALQDILDGDFAAAIEKCAREWASLPGSPYGQPTMSLDLARALYLQHGGRPEPAPTQPVADAQAPAPVEDRTIPPDTPPALEPAMPIPIMIPIVLEALASLVPAIADIVGDKTKTVPERNIAAAVKLVDVAKTAIGAANEQDLVERIQADPQAAQAVKQAVQSVYFELAESGGGGIAGAAERALLMATSPIPPWKNPAMIVTILLLPMIYGVVGAVIFGAGWDSNIRSFVVGVVVGSTLGAVVAFWLGSSFGSDKKTNSILEAKSRVPG
jgi:muramidase (phage lysozyme)